MEQRCLNKRIHKWTRFTEIFGDFCETFFDHVSRVKNKSAMASFEKKNAIATWEWKTIESLITVGDVIPAPHCEEALDVYLRIFGGHAEYADLVDMKNGTTPLTAVRTWESTHTFCISPRSSQARSREYDTFFTDNKRKIRAWTRRWNAKNTQWTSRNRSTVSKFLRDEMSTDATRGTPPATIDILDEWLLSIAVLKHENTALQTLEYDILHRCNGDSRNDAPDKI